MTLTNLTSTLNSFRQAGLLVGVLAFGMASTANAAGPAATTAPTPYTATCTAYFAVGLFGGECGNMAFPDGKRFVIQQIIVSALLPAGQSFIAHLDYGLLSGWTTIQIPTQKQALGLSDNYTAALPVTIYAELSGLAFHASRNSSTGTAGTTVHLIGYLVTP